MVRAEIAALLVLLAMALAGGLAGERAARAQGAAFACPAEPPPVASTPFGGAAAASPVPFPQGSGELTVFAAASLTDAFERIGDDLSERYPELTIAYNFAGSQALVTQLREGAAADVVALADSAQIAAAVANGSVADSPVVFARNRLAIVVPADNPAGVDDPADLGGAGLRLVFAQAEVPVGRYARTVVCRMGEDAATYGAGFVERVAGNVVSEEEDVRDVLTKVRLGEADAGIVYRSDALAGGDEVREIAIPDEVNVVANYPIVAVAGGDRALADAFLGYLLGREGQATLAEAGFQPVSNP